MHMSYTYRQLQRGDVGLFRELNKLFGEAFNDTDTYHSAPPSRAYIDRLLQKPHIIPLVAQEGDTVVGGLVAYQLDKCERERSEIYIYDLAVAEIHRRRGIARALINALRKIAKERGTSVIYVQADYGDDPAIALYASMGVKEEVMHFDIPVE